MHNTKGKQKYFGKMESLGGAQIFCEEQRCYWIDQNLRAYSSDKQIYVTNKLLIDHKKSSESKKAKRIWRKCKNMFWTEVTFPERFS